jgi:50S ribosomal subunit-associated GTPase HflX
MARRAGTNRDFLTMALAGYEAEIVRIYAAIREIQAQLGRRGPGRPRVATDGAAPKKRTMSLAARRRIAAAQRKRWAQAKKSQRQAAKAAPKKRKLSTAGRRAIIAATKKRWAAARKAAAGAA